MRKALDKPNKNVNEQNDGDDEIWTKLMLDWSQFHLFKSSGHRPRFANLEGRTCVKLPLKRKHKNKLYTQWALDKTKPFGRRAPFNDTCHLSELLQMPTLCLVSKHEIARVICFHSSATFFSSDLADDRVSSSESFAISWKCSNLGRCARASNNFLVIEVLFPGTGGIFAPIIPFLPRPEWKLLFLILLSLRNLLSSIRVMKVGKGGKKGQRFELLLGKRGTLNARVSSPSSEQSSNLLSQACSIFVFILSLGRRRPKDFF